MLFPKYRHEKGSTQRRKHDGPVGTRRSFASYIYTSVQLGDGVRVVVSTEVWMSRTTYVE